MLELSTEQLSQLDDIRQNEVFERLLLEVQQENPEWLSRKGLMPALQMLKDLRERAWGFGIREPESVEHFLRHGLTFTDFDKQPAFIEFMNRPVADSPERRFEDYEDIVVFRMNMQHWRDMQAVGEIRP
ncbi:MULTISPECIES: hypothetical protein [Pseudomonas]|uniref:hypothetical protein n=1 Tax=Pseudomonas TaxID=286 RepID=UPI000CD0A831|nr:MULTISPECIES: hypothetical protein [Pseudomonas]POA75568.1 hypothetical protein C1888_01290 [Pseudomonas sp. GW531-T4]